MYTDHHQHHFWSKLVQAFLPRESSFSLAFALRFHLKLLLHLYHNMVIVSLIHPMPTNLFVYLQIPIHSPGGMNHHYFFWRMGLVVILDVSFSYSSFREVHLKQELASRLL